MQPAGQDPENARTDTKAIWSLVLGILSLTCFWILTGIPAIVLGHLSRSDIRRSTGRLKGEGMALAGLICGYISVALIPVILILASIAIPTMLRARQSASEAAAVANLRTLGTAETSYHSTVGDKYGDIEALIEARLVDDSFLSTKAGYNFNVVADSESFTATATPATSNTGRYGYYATEDGEIRYSSDVNLAPGGQAGLPIN
jgi:hypothetical protein